ncbi:hypothetical protein I8748_32585 [Nostoc sp. CENA67]|uniref:Uncharacterized protein n=1 Tax=Amazonocrinis nigriterrae CENA67 TaxID=2794033 RepID=A0A8J7HVW6_9NOST|nr:hypothetical protein [Amazonocrinis nigriterrae]MBH8566831.1 hypothetical protein [Amazonocrinis nigriterrae CENA67]
MAIKLSSVGSLRVRPTYVGFPIEAVHPWNESISDERIAFYCTLYNAKGEVIEDLGDEVWVAWQHWQDKPKKTDRYFKTELRLWVDSSQ